ncbi:hypothetical protein IYX23_05640 [Methylocystis sp. L43]|uniref:hypothetical protein n=1 Tax=unclassified Methylocystis TaxID=2625913 RepID=UPI0018C34585|nr:MULTISPECIES: hypothetical protein [unclassified Methylocystis]MBG0797169.1 hypothetical protein [Methylocystis sp. L43]MBG0804960.1 hypothetical protein [Methylocystis sp. H15]
MIAALSSTDRTKLYALAEALHRAAASGERRWAAFPIVRSCVGELMASIRRDCSAADVDEVARRVLTSVDYRERFDGAIELALTEILVHGVRWSWERC